MLKICLLSYRYRNILTMFASSSPCFSSCSSSISFSFSVSEVSPIMLRRSLFVRANLTFLSISCGTGLCVTAHQGVVLTSFADLSFSFRHRGDGDCRNFATLCSSYSTCLFLCLLRFPFLFAKLQFFSITRKKGSLGT